MRQSRWCPVGSQEFPFPLRRVSEKDDKPHYTTEVTPIPRSRASVPPQSQVRAPVRRTTPQVPMRLTNRPLHCAEGDSFYSPFPNRSAARGCRTAHASLGFQNNERPSLASRQSTRTRPPHPSGSSGLTRDLLPGRVAATQPFPPPRGQDSAHEHSHTGAHRSACLVDLSCEQLHPCMPARAHRSRARGHRSVFGHDPRSPSDVHVALERFG
jgi:hypothetical protein